MKKWTILIILAMAQFVMVLDSTVMNVSLSTVAADLGTTITGMQVAITLYTLTMAALMLTGGKLGDIWGRRKTFKIGSVVYGIGSLVTGLAPTLPVLLVGWSIIEGLGAVLVIPAIAALAAVNYKGKDRVIAFAVIGGISGAAAAAGPLIGGLVTTYASWRYVFIAETVIMLFVLLTTSKISDQAVTKSQKIDLPSVLLSTAGMGLLIFGILQSKTWGWVLPMSAPEINGQPITPLGISLVAYMIAFGVFVLWIFFKRQQTLEVSGTALLKVSLLKIPELRSGLSVLLSQYLVIAAAFFVVPVYLQTVLGMNALETGLKILPLSVALIVFSIYGTRLATSRSPKQVARIGQIALALGSLVLLASINPELRGLAFATGMFAVGAGLGLLASQLGNVNMTAVGQENSAEGGGLQGTFQNLGSSLGTALIGSIFIASLTSGFAASVSASDLRPEIKTYVSEQSQKGLQIVSEQQVYDFAKSKGLSSDEAATVASQYTDAQINGLRESLFYLMLIALFSLFLSQNLPDQRPKGR